MSELAATCDLEMPSLRENILDSAAYYRDLARQLEEQYLGGGGAALISVSRFRQEWDAIEGALLWAETQGIDPDIVHGELVEAASRLMELVTPARQRLRWLALARQ